jgi:hypothetical protein
MEENLMVDEQDKPLSLVMFSGTDDKLTAAAVLAVGAAAMGRPVNLFLQYGSDEPAGATMALAQAQGAITLFI